MNAEVSAPVLGKRFKRIRAFYRKHEAAIMADGREWFGDAYAWEHLGGIVLTPIERMLWYDIRAEDAVLYPQYPVGRFFVDFGNPVAKVAIECDGAQWHTDAARDATRQAEIEAAGWTVYRISGRDCVADTQEVEDENGRVRVQLSVARLLIREVCERHGVRRWRNS